MSRYGWNASGEICIACHTPHHADQTVTSAPLWNHQVTSSAFVPYSSTTLNATVGQPDGITKLCLSCHDGTIALDSFGGDTGAKTIGSDGLIGTDLSDHHPVSFSYTSSLASADGELYDPATTPSGLGGTIREDLLEGDTMQCSSCHDVHVGRSTGSCSDCHITVPGIGMVIRTVSIWKSNDGSALCLTCHKK